MKIKTILQQLLVVILCTSFATAGAQTTSKTQTLSKDLSPLKGCFNFYVANDLGRNGYYDQKPIAELMGKMAGEVGPEFVVAAGDVHHFEGVRSVNDPLWMTNYELIYSHPDLMIDWFPVLGNHEYRGSTQAVLDYTNMSRRWNMKSRYYTQTYTTDDGQSIRLVYLDTAPLIDKYRNDSLSYPDAYKQDMNRELAWTDSVLTVSTEKWKIVIGHHPIYAETPKSADERSDMQARLDPILRKHNVDMYICGHIHNFQHIRIKGSDIDYVVNSSASLSRKVKLTEGTQFCSSEPGFSICSVSKKGLFVYMINKKGEIIYIMKRTK